MTTSTDNYLQNRDITNFVIRNTPSTAAQTAKIITNTAGFATIGGIVGNALPFIEEAYPGAFGSIPENALSILKPAFEYLLPAIPSTNYIPIALAGIGGAIAFSFTYYRQRNLNTQATFVKTALEPFSNKLVTDSEFKNIQSLLPSYDLKKEFAKKKVITDKEITQLVSNKDAEKEAKYYNIKTFLNDMPKLNLEDADEVNEYYEYFKKFNIDEKTLVDQVFANSWDLSIEIKQHILKYFEINKIKMPFWHTSPASNDGKEQIEDDNESGLVQNQNIFEGVTNEQMADHPFINSLILRTNIFDDTTYEDIHNQLNRYQKDAMSWMLNWPAFASNNRQNIRDIVKNITDGKNPYNKLPRDTWNNLNANERKALFRLLQAPELPANRVVWHTWFEALRQEENDSSKQTTNNNNINNNQAGNDSPSLEFSDSSSGS